MVHSKIKGNIGEAATILILLRNGFNVFTEVGDLSKIDLIAEKNMKFWRIQVKCITPKNGCLNLPLKKAGPNYRFSYSKEQFDFFAVVDIVNNQVGFIPSSILDSHKSLLCLRIEDKIKGDIEDINLFSNYLDPCKMLTGIENDINFVPIYKGRVIDGKSRIPRMTKINWPSEEELKKLIEETNHNLVQMGKKLGVTDNAIRKQLKRLGLYQRKNKYPLVRAKVNSDYDS